MRNLRSSAICVIAFLTSVSAFAQDRSGWRTAADIQEGARGSIVGTVASTSDSRNELTLDPDDDHSSRVTVVADALTTQYNGFGGVINGQPEIFTGSPGFANLRVGDRVEVRGIARNAGVIAADYVTLLGRSVPAPQTGVGQTRSPGAGGASTPTASSTATSSRVGTVEGTVQEVNASEGRLVIVTDRREVLSITTSNATPVYYRGETYRVANLEIGDRVRVQPDTGSTSGGISAQSVQVLKSVQEGTPAPKSNMVSGRVATVDRTIDMITVDTGRSSVKVDVATATDTSGRRIRAGDFQAGDRVEVNGRYSSTSADLFIANTIRFTDQTTPAAPPPAATPPADRDVFGAPPAVSELGSVTIYGTVRETLNSSPQLVLRDTSGRTVRINVLEDFVVRGRNNAFVTADRLKENDNLVVKAYRDADGNYIAQTIRIR